MLKQLSKSIPAMNRDVLATKVEANINQLSEIIASIEDVVRHSEVNKDSTLVDFPNLSKEFKSEIGYGLFSKNLIKDLKKIIGSESKFLKLVFDILPKKVSDPETLTARELGLVWYILCLETLVTYINQVYSYRAISLLHSSVAENLGITRDNKEYLLENVHSVAKILMYLRNPKTIKTSLEALPDTIASDEDAMRHAVVYNPLNVQDNLVFQSHGFIGTVALYIRTQWLLGVDAWYNLMERRTVRLRNAVALLQLANEGSYSSIREEKLEELTDTIQKMEATLTEYRRG